MDEIIPRFPAEPNRKDPRQIRMVRFACVGIIAMVAVGIWAEAPYLAAEHSRLEPWRILEVWCADILAVLWFTRFTFAHAILGEPLAPVTVENSRDRIKGVAFVGVAALLLELYFCLSLMYDERKIFATTVPTKADVLKVSVHDRELAAFYDLDCSFQDQTGQTQLTHVRVQAKNHLMPARLPNETIEVLESHGKIKNQILIRYDPRFPARAWVEGVDWDDENAIYWFSLLTFFFQGIITGLFLLLLFKYSTKNFLPWWWDIYKVLPLVVAGFWLFVMGLIDRALG